MSERNKTLGNSYAQNILLQQGPGPLFTAVHTIS